MQTFITDSPEVGYGVEYLDQKRLVKQLLESRQIMAALAGQTKGWVNHPATKMWRGNEECLFEYAKAVKDEMARRGYLYEKNWMEINRLVGFFDYDVRGPKWFYTDEYNKVVYTHRGRLYEKDPVHYAGWVRYSDYKKNVCCERCNYYWPTHLEVSV
jgi:hypothetical protein